MLNAALQHPQPNVAYALGKVEALPFANETFDAVTACMAFHWFMNKKAIAEIKRVLKPRGVLCIIQPRYTAIQKDFRMILERELQRKIPKIWKSGDQFAPFLVQNGFRIARHFVPIKIQYTIDEYLGLLQSCSPWNYVPRSRQVEMLGILKRHYRSKIKEKYVQYLKNVEVIIAQPLK